MRQAYFKQTTKSLKFFVKKKGPLSFFSTLLSFIYSYSLPYCPTVYSASSKELAYPPVGRLAAYKEDLQAFQTIAISEGSCNQTQLFFPILLYLLTFRCGQVLTKKAAYY